MPERVSFFSTFGVYSMERCIHNHNETYHINLPQISTFDVYIDINSKETEMNAKEIKMKEAEDKLDIIITEYGMLNGKYVDVMLNKFGELAKDVLENYPEYSSEYIQCREWKEDKYKFFVEDPDEDGIFTKFIVAPEDVRKAIYVLYLEIMVGDIHCDGLDIENFFDAGAWDQTALDIMMQYYFYGEFIFS